MKISTNYQHNAMPKTNFGEIKSVRYQGLYKGREDLVNHLIDTFMENKQAIDFCTEYDVDIVFDARKSCDKSVESTLAIIFDTPVMNKFQSFLKSLKLSKPTDIIDISGYGNKYVLEDSLLDSTRNLIDNIREVGGTGVLNGNIRYKKDVISEFKANKTKMQEHELAMNKKSDKTKSKKDAEKLQASIRALIDKTS